MILIALNRPELDRSVRSACALAELIRFTGLGTPLALEKARDAARSRNDADAEANCIWSLGDIALARSDHDQARDRYEAALPLYRRVGAVLGEANCIRSLGDIALARSDHDQARDRYEDALPLYRRVGSVLGEANCIRSLGDIALDARTTTRPASATRTRCRSTAASVCPGRGQLHLEPGRHRAARSDHDQARDRYEDALPLFRRVGSVLGEANCIQSLGDIALRRSDHDQARERYEDALPLYRRVGSCPGRGQLHPEPGRHRDATLGPRPGPRTLRGRFATLPPRRLTSWARPTASRAWATSRWRARTTTRPATATRPHCHSTDASVMSWARPTASGAWATSRCCALGPRPGPRTL